MTLSPSQKFEITADAFFYMTGFIAPGKDIASARGPVNEALRCKIWIEWRDEHRMILDAVFRAIEEEL